MTFEGGQLDKHGNSKTGAIMQKRVREVVDATQGLSPNLNVWDLAAIAQTAIVEPIAPLPRSLPHEQVKSC